MKKKVCIIVIFAMIVMVIKPVSVFASDSDLEEQKGVLEIAKEADMFYYFVDHGFYSWCCYPEYADEEMLSFAEEKGYVTEAPGERIIVDFDGSEIWYYPYAPQMDSFEKWNGELKSYFVEDFLGLLDNDSLFKPPLVIEKEGVTYGTSQVREYRGFFGWDDVAVTKLTKIVAILTAPEYYYYDDGIGTYGEKTIELVKTEDGWRVSGGSYFGNENSLPETGDSTAAYALIFTLAALPLAGLCVAEWKRRRRAV